MFFSIKVGCQINPLLSQTVLIATAELKGNHKDYKEKCISNMLGTIVSLIELAEKEYCAFAVEQTRPDIIANELANKGKDNVITVSSLLQFKSAKDLFEYVEKIRGN